MFLKHLVQSNASSTLVFKRFCATSRFGVCWTTCGKEEEAEELASSLLKKKVCACISIIPKVTSMYWWKGEICKDKEYSLMIKYAKHNEEILIDSIKTLHSYDIPEIICVDIMDGNKDYFNWILQTTKE